MTTLMKTCAKTAAVLGIVAAAYGCKKKDEYGSSTAASPGTSAYASPSSDAYASPGMGTTGTGSMAAPVAVEVVAVDTAAGTITVADVMAGAGTGATGTAPGSSRSASGTSATGGRADNRTLPVQSSARSDLSRVKVGDHVMIMCSDTSGMGTSGMGTTTGTGTTGTGTGATGTGSMGMASASPGSMGSSMTAGGGLSGCTMVSAIMPETGTSGRGR
jgi:hypothetical protein